MSYLELDKSKLVNLEYSLDKEVLRTNRAGSYACSTIIGCNTRKYHGLLVCPIDQFDGEKHVLLSALDVTVVQHDAEFNLGIHKYNGDNYEPKGHKYIREFESDVIPSLIYRVGGVLLRVERLLAEREDQVLVKYTLEEAHSATRLRLQPFLAFRNIHALSKANLFVNRKITKVPNGIKTRLYDGYPNLFMQLSKDNEFIQVPDWYYNIEYLRELERGYDYKEDLFVPGYFEIALKKGESIIFSASTKEAAPNMLTRKFKADLTKRVPRNSFLNCLKNAAQQFTVKRNKETEVIAGYPWFDSWGRDTFMALPGLLLTQDDEDTFKAVMDTMVKKLKNGLFPNTGKDDQVSYNSIDAPLWFFHALQQYTMQYGNAMDVWKKYGKYMKAILKAYKEGTSFHIRMNTDGLIYGGEPGEALTWMDAIVNGKPVTSRHGSPVEINALWYNAVMFALELAQSAKDSAFVNQWKGVPEKTKAAFIGGFWDAKKAYLADVVNENGQDWSVRPNQVIAASLPYSMLDSEKKAAVLKVVKSELLTPRGLRSLSPKNENYEGVYQGNQTDRDAAYHQGSVWPWLIEHYCRAYLEVYKRSGLAEIERLFQGFEQVMYEHGLGTVSEIYDGDPPHQARGAISQAWSVAALLQVNNMIESFS